MNERRMGEWGLSDGAKIVVVAEWRVRAMGRIVEWRVRAMGGGAEWKGRAMGGTSAAIRGQRKDSGATVMIQGGSVATAKAVWLTG